MAFVPDFKFETSTCEVTLRPSEAAVAVAQQIKKEGATVTAVLTGKRVKEDARARVSHRGGDPEEPKEVLAESWLQFGKYRGQTFKWLLGNDVGYATGIIVSHMKESESGSGPQTPLSQNKDALVTYAKLFAPMAEVITRRRIRDGKASERGLDARLVGFGQHGHKTFKSLYMGKDRESKT